MAYLASFLRESCDRCCCCLMTVSKFLFQATRFGLFIRLLFSLFLSFSSRCPYPWFSTYFSFELVACTMRAFVVLILLALSLSLVLFLARKTLFDVGRLRTEHLSNHSSHFTCSFLPVLRDLKSSTLAAVASR